MRISDWSSDACSSDLPDPGEALFKICRLELRADEDRGAVERNVLALEVFEFFADPPRFLGPVPYADDADLVASIELGPQRLAEAVRVLRAQRRCRGADLRRRAVILLEADHSLAGEILFQTQYFQIGK